MGRKMDAALHAAWRRRWQEFERSSVTVGEFCRQQGVSQATFYRWRRRFISRGEKAAKAPATTKRGAALRRPAEPRASRSAFVEVALGCAAVVVLDLPNGVRVHVPADRESALGVVIHAAGELACGPAALAKEAAPC